jgi:hypothetical protein
MEEELGAESSSLSSYVPVVLSFERRLAVSVDFALGL